MQRKIIIHVNIINIHASVCAHVYTNINGGDEEPVVSNTHTHSHTHTHTHSYIVVMIYASHNPSDKFDEAFEFL